MEVEVQPVVLLVPPALVRFFGVAAAFGDALKLRRGQYALPLAPHLKPPTERAWRWLLDALTLMEITERQARDTEESLKYIMFGIADTRDLHDMGPGELTALLALGDFYDVAVLMPSMTLALALRLRRVLGQVEYSDAVLPDVTQRVLHQEALWRAGVRQWLQTRLRSRELVQLVVHVWPLLGPLVACGQDHTLMLAHDGLWGCGATTSGQLGRPVLTKPRVPVPVRLDGAPPHVVQVACGAFFSAAVTRDGELWVCGDNSHGQLALGDKEARFEWTRVTFKNPNDRVRQVACGRKYMLMLMANTALYVVGDDRYGQLGRGPGAKRAVKRLERVRLADGSAVLRVACGAQHSVVVSTSGVWACGDNSVGQLGVGDRDTRNVLTRVEGLPSPLVEHVACGGFHTIVSVGGGDDATAWGWGSNMANQLGLGAADEERRLQPVPLQPDTGLIDLACGLRHTLMVTRDGRFTKFGGNAGQLSWGDNFSHTALHVYAGYSQSFVLSDTGLWACGDNMEGQLGVSDRQVVLRLVKAPTRVRLQLEPQRDEKRPSHEALVDERVTQRRRLGGQLCVHCDALSQATALQRYRFCGAQCYASFFAPHTGAEDDDAAMNVQ